MCIALFWMSRHVEVVFKNYGSPEATKHKYYYTFWENSRNKDKLKKLNKPLDRTFSYQTFENNFLTLCHFK